VLETAVRGSTPEHAALGARLSGQVRPVSPPASVVSALDTASIAIYLDLTMIGLNERIAT
jgi:hypothetical protein